MQFNDGGSLGGDAGFAYDKTTDQLTVSGAITFGAVSGLAAPANSFVGGATTQVQFNNNGVFDGSTNLVWDSANSRLGVGTTTPTQALHVAGSIYVGTLALASGTA